MYTYAERACGALGCSASWAAPPGVNPWKPRSRLPPWSMVGLSRGSFEPLVALPFLFLDLLEAAISQAGP